jgi:hypothetical protein
MTTSTQSPSREFADAVRLALSDLPAEEVDELTDGLEADLAERAEDETAPVLGDPLAYASELRAAAGLPPRSGHGPATLDAGLASAWRDFADGLRGISSHPLIARLGAFFASLRPLWWLVRAWAFYGILTWLFNVPSLQLTPLTFVLGAGTLITSVQFGRGRWLPRGWMRKVLLGVNIVLALASPLILLATTSTVGSQVDAVYGQGVNDGARQQNGLTYNGREITNIFAYDADGTPLSQVQLYDQSGHPLYTVPSAQTTTRDSPYLVPYQGIHGRGGWNVYPLEFVTASQLNVDDNPKRNATPSPSVLLNLLVPPLGHSTSTATPTPGPTETPAP